MPTSKEFFVDLEILESYWYFVEINVTCEEN
jgi:hypothetical protein